MFVVISQRFTEPEAISAQIERWKSQYSLQISTEILPGVRTIGNNPINIIKMSKDVGQNRAVPNKLIIGNLDGNDVLSTEMIYLFTRTIQNFLTDASLENIFNNNQVYIIYAANPDALNLYWKGNTTISRNLNDVFLDSNFLAGWNESCSGSTDKTFGNYKGPTPSSELEVTAIRNFLKSKSFSSILNFKKVSRGNSGMTLNYPVGCYENPISSSLKGKFFEVGQSLKNNVSFSLNVKESNRSGSLILDAFRNFGSLAFELEIGETNGQNSSLIPIISPLVNEFIYKFLSMNDSTATITNEGGISLSSKVEVFDNTSNLITTLYSNEDHFGIVHFWLPNGNYTLKITKPGYQELNLQVSLPFSQNFKFVMSVFKNLYIVTILYPIALIVFLVNIGFLILYQVIIKLFDLKHQ